MTERPDIHTLGELRAAGYEHRPLRLEIRENLLSTLAEGRNPWPGLHGLEDTVLPQLERALLAGHDVVLLGERGQGKTRLLRTLAGLLDEWSPEVRGSELHEHPEDPLTEAVRERIAIEGDDLPIAWRHREERYVEKLATPDTSVADLIGDVDPIRVAEGRRLGDPETIHYGLIPRAHRGIVAINELPDLAERIQVSMLNVMEERDVQIRGYVLRLPLDVLVVASANPEDYTNRGRIITPLKDRFGAEIRTHYPLELADEIAVTRQEAELVAEVPEALLEILARYTRLLRQSPAVDQRSGVSARFSIAGAETTAASALRRAAIHGEEHAVARLVDVEAAVEVLAGKIEFESGEEGREIAVLEHLLRRATMETVQSRLRGIDLGPLIEALDGTVTVSTGGDVPARDLLAELPALEDDDADPVEDGAGTAGDGSAGAGLYDRIAERLGASTPGQRANAIELALEALFLSQKISKDADAEGTVYG
ncbi:sigma 54-interacting transcriptional regulator [Rothia halotolerans]|uniref:sigma 54-interacting transcriptional regulator n=1 Tax=Rothia halotolerans TaxID=405770 RepID=UPI00101C9732|nr:sigma 54-interacting transcriptional regulator [Rothia halotolerans]